MTRFKWYKIRVSGAPALFLRRINAAKFTPEATSGFLPPVDRNVEAGGLRFLWRSSVVAVGLDEFGNRTSEIFKSIEQLSVRFYPAEDHVLIRITDPPRATRELFNTLERVAGMGMSVEPVVFTEKQRGSMLNRCDEFRLIGLRGVGTSVEYRVVARIDLASKVGIEPEGLTFLKDLQFVADQSSYEILEQGLKGQVTFTASGAVRITGVILPFILSKFDIELGIGS